MYSSALSGMLTCQLNSECKKGGKTKSGMSKGKRCRPGLVKENDGHEHRYPRLCPKEHCSLVLCSAECDEAHAVLCNEGKRPTVKRVRLRDLDARIKVSA